MKSASAELITLLGSSSQVLMSDLLTITLRGGSALYLTSADANIAYGGHTYDSRGIQFTRSKVRTVVGVEVDKLDVSLFGDSTTLVNGLPLLQAAIQGEFDGAQIDLQRAFMQVWGDVVGTLAHFTGKASQIDIGRTEVRMEVASNLELLNIKMPRNMWQPGCINTLYDTACGLTRTAVTGNMTANSTASVINCNLSNPAGLFNLGYITCTSGTNNGVSRTVKSYTAGQVTLANPLPLTPVAGDLFSAYKGCDKKQTTCDSYGNLARFRGFPYVPAPDILT